MASSGFVAPAGECTRSLPGKTDISRAQSRLSALEALYERHWSELCGYLKKRFGSGPPEPQDVAQQAFLRYATAPESTQVQNERAYLYRIAHNILVEERRRLSVRRAALASLEIRTPTRANELTPERVLIASERLAILRNVLTAAPEIRRRSFTLHRLDGLPCAEIARRTGYSESAVKKHVTLVLADIATAMHRANEGQQVDI